MNQALEAPLSIIKYPILSEKTIRLFERNQYSFAVSKTANKTSVRLAIEQLFDVTVLSVNTLQQPVKKRRVGKFIGKKAQDKKVIVTLAPDSSITLFEEN